MQVSDTVVAVCASLECVCVTDCVCDTECVCVTGVCVPVRAERVSPRKKIKKKKKIECKDSVPL